MVIPRNEIWEKLITLVSSIDTMATKQLGKELTYTNDTDLVDDLGLVGDDAYNFMEAYATTFNIQQGDYKTTNYFEPEGLWLIPTFKKKQPKMHITLGMLYLAAKLGTWDTNALNQSRIQKKYK